MGFIISRNARNKYAFDDALFNSNGNVEFRDFKAVQRFGTELNDIPARAGEINAMSLIHDIFKHVIHLYSQQKNPLLWEKIMTQLRETLDKESPTASLRLLAKEFPAPAVYSGESTAAEYLEGTSSGIPHRYLLLEELLQLWLTNINPACAPYKKTLFDDTVLEKQSSYRQIIAELERFFAAQPGFGPKNQNLVAMLRSPAIVVPHSLTGQLQYIRENWGDFLGEFLSRLLLGLDLLKEEEKFGGMGPGETAVYDFSQWRSEEEDERFSTDLHWMPRLVLIAKSTFVWLDQLSKQYRRHIYRLDHIPDEELDILSRQGFTGLWLIGVWERSHASRRIKQMCGNPEALASAYSIYEYRVAADLGGEEALQNLKHRAWQRGIRLASDMVPNHMGIDSPWLVEHPDRFLSLDYCPYPSYSFNGVDLSPDPRVSIYLEDHYYDRTDAAVVFKWVDNRSGQVRYIYHGNDGTSMPWNDTAQLNYLNPDTREAVTGTIFSVAAQFPIIRFDAAMTLSKRHYQRLWFPEPGSGGDIPTRAWQGMNGSEFHRLMPEEFWRQVVDRFAAAQSDTLLLAEAFWLMEAYFVRTLGMHRVYNSAFMNFLKNEENDKFRASIKNILQFNPEILKRFVNFMNNPDEETAEAQFGKGDKYFGVCTLMVTLPGLPMFGHGQIEGYTEKYGMEYRRAYRDEVPDQDLVQRHEREIFPLLRKRYLFAEVEGFLFYDFFTPEGWVNEDVIAYSNSFANGRSLVVYHNAYAETSGWINMSVPSLVKTGSGDTLSQKSLAEGLGLTPEDNYYTLFRDHDTGLEYIRNSKELYEKGLFVELKAYKRHVFLEFREVGDGGERYYGQLAAMLHGEGVPDIHKALRKHFYNPLLKPCRELFDPALFQRLLAIVTAAVPDAAPGGSSKTGLETAPGVSGEPETTPAALAQEVQEKLGRFLEAVQGVIQYKSGNPGHQAQRLRRKLEGIIAFITKNTDPELLRLREEVVRTIGVVDFTWFFIETMGAMLEENSVRRIWQLLDEWLLLDEIIGLFTASGVSRDRAVQWLGLTRIMIRRYGWWNEQESSPNRWESLFDDEDVMHFLQVNRHENVLWFQKESAEEFSARLRIAALWEILDPGELREFYTPESKERLTRYSELVRHMDRVLRQSAYRWESFKELLNKH